MASLSPGQPLQMPSTRGPAHTMSHQTSSTSSSSTKSDTNPIISQQQQQQKPSTHQTQIPLLKEKILSLLKTASLLNHETQEQRNALIQEITKQMSNTSLHTHAFLENLYQDLEGKYTKYAEFEHVYSKVHFGNLELMKPVTDPKTHQFVLGKVSEVKMVGPHVMVGKDPECDVCIQKMADKPSLAVPESTLRFISKHHFTICYDDVTGTFYLINKSRNGTLVDDFLVTTEPFVLHGSLSAKTTESNGQQASVASTQGYNEIRIGEILLGRDPLFFTLNTCVFRFRPVDVKLADV